MAVTRRKAVGALRLENRGLRREGREVGRELKILLKAVRANCLNCAGESAREVDICEITYCPFWRHRFGVPPGDVADGSKVDIGLRGGGSEAP